MSTEFAEYAAVIDSVYPDWPLVTGVLGLDDLSLSWQMEYYERAALVFVLQNLRPAVAVEVGTHSGGSLAVLARFAQRVYSLDIEPESSKNLSGRFTNVSFVVGDSKQTLPPILSELQASSPGPIFILIDGDHSQAGVLADLKNVFKLRPSHPVVVMAHDSFNPGVRAGLLEAPWSENPHVHYVEIDFQHGSIFDRLGHRRQMWGGLAMAILLPKARTGDVEVSQRHRLLFDIVVAESAHRPTRRTWLSRMFRQPAGGR